VSSVRGLEGNIQKWPKVLAIFIKETKGLELVAVVKDLFSRSSELLCEVQGLLLRRYQLLHSET
jgi:hypothetical protein